MTRLERAKKFFKSNAASALVLPLIFIASNAWAGSIVATPQFGINSQTLSFKPSQGGWAFGNPQCTSSCGFTGLSQFRDGSTFNDGVQGISLFGNIQVYCTVQNCAGDSFTLDISGNTGTADVASGLLHFDFYSDTDQFEWSVLGESGHYDGDDDVNADATFAVTNKQWDIQLTITPDGNASQFDLVIPRGGSVPLTLDISDNDDSTAVPEPGSLMLMLTGAGALLGLRKRIS